MPVSKMSVKSGTEYAVTYSVSGSLDDLNQDQLKRLAEAYLKTKARNFVQTQLNANEPAIAANILMKENMLKAGLGTPETVDAFFKMSGYLTEVQTTFVIPLTDLVPADAPTRGRKAVSVFEANEPDADDEEAETTPAV